MTSMFLSKLSESQQQVQREFSNSITMKKFSIDSPIFGLLICIFISENQGLEKLRSALNLRKISGPAQLNFFFSTPEFFFSLSPDFFFRFIP